MCNEFTVCSHLWTSKAPSYVRNKKNNFAQTEALGCINFRLAISFPVFPRPSSWIANKLKINTLCVTSCVSLYYRGPIGKPSGLQNTEVRVVSHQRHRMSQLICSTGIKLIKFCFILQHICECRRSQWRAKLVANYKNRNNRLTTETGTTGQLWGPE